MYSVERSIRYDKKAGTENPELYAAEKNTLKPIEHDTATSEDYVIASRRTVKSNPKVKASTAKMVSKAILASRTSAR